MRSGIAVLARQRGAAHLLGALRARCVVAAEMVPPGASDAMSAPGSTTSATLGQRLALLLACETSSRVCIWQSEDDEAFRIRCFDVNPTPAALEKGRQTAHQRAVPAAPIVEVHKEVPRADGGRREELQERHYQYVSTVFLQSTS